MNDIGKDLSVEVLARLGPGADALRCTRVCRAWDAWLRTEWCYLRMIQCGGLPKNKDIFGKGEGQDPNNWKGYQKQLKAWWGEEASRRRKRIVACDTAKELLSAMYDGGGGTRKQLMAALDHYQRFDHAPLWCLAGRTDLDETEQANMVHMLLYAGANVDLTGGSGVRTTPLQQAVRAGRPAVITLLLLAGAVVDKYGGSFQQTPLVLAAGECGDAVITQRLVAAGADLAAEDEDGLIAMHRAILNHRLDVLNYFAELLRWKLSGSGALTRGHMARPVLLSYSIFSPRLPDQALCARLAASADWLEGLRYMVREGLITQEVMKSAALDACERTKYSCPQMFGWLVGEHVIEERDPRLLDLLCGHNLEVRSLACVASAKKVDVLEKIFVQRAWQTLRSLYRLKWIETEETVLIYLRDLMEGDLHGAGANDFYANTIASLFEWEYETFANAPDLEPCVRANPIVERKVKEVRGRRGRGLRAFYHHDYGEYMERYGGGDSRDDGDKPPLPIKFYLKGPQYVEALFKNDRCRGREVFYMLEYLALRGADMSGALAGLLDRVGAISQDLSLQEFGFMLKYIPFEQTLCCHPETRDTLLHALLRVPQCGHLLFGRLRNWVLCQRPDALALRNANNETVLEMAQRLGHARLPDVVDIFEETEEEMAAAAVPAAGDYPSKEDADYEARMEVYNEQQRAYDEAVQTLQAIEERRELPYAPRALEQKRVSSSSWGSRDRQVFQESRRKSRFFELCRPAEPLPPLAPLHEERLLDESEEDE